MPRTVTLGLPRVEGEAGLAAAAHGRPMRGAGSTGFGRAVRATACVGCAKQSHTRVNSYTCDELAAWLGQPT